MDPHIFSDPDPGSQNLADPTDPDPKHCCVIFGNIFVQSLFANIHTNKPLECKSVQSIQSYLVPDTLRKHLHF